VPVPPAELRVFAPGEPRPASERDAAGVRAAMSAASDRQLEVQVRSPQLAATLRGGFETALSDALPAKVDPVPGSFRSLPGDGFDVHQSVLARAGGLARVPTIGIVPKGWKAGPVVVWVHDEGKRAAFESDGRTPSTEVKALLAGGAAVLAPDVFLTGENGAIGGRARVKNDETYFGYNTGYNRTVLAERASDVLTALAFAKQLGGRDVSIVARGRSALAVLLARPFAGDLVARTSVDVGGFDFPQVTSTLDERLLPGSVKYGGVRGLASLATTGRTVVFGMPKGPAAAWPSLPLTVLLQSTPATPGALVGAVLKP
jgi:hypothetical protein